LDRKGESQNLLDCTSQSWSWGSRSGALLSSCEEVR